MKLLSNCVKHTIAPQSFRLKNPIITDSPDHTKDVEEILTNSSMLLIKATIKNLRTKSKKTTEKYIHRIYYQVVSHYNSYFTKEINKLFIHSFIHSFIHCEKKILSFFFKK